MRGLKKKDDTCISVGNERYQEVKVLDYIYFGGTLSNLRGASSLYPVCEECSFIGHF